MDAKTFFNKLAYIFGHYEFIDINERIAQKNSFNRWGQDV